jgi:outer membrane beta-barrel protein
MRLSSRFSAGWLILIVLISARTFAADKAKKAPAPAPGAGADPNQAGELLEVEKVKEKYWAQGQDSKMGVVQNRVYTKEGKFVLGALGGTTIADPFLSIKQYGGVLGYHFNEFIGVEALGWKNVVGKSSALKTAEQQGKDQNTVDPRWFMGAEGLGSIMYGKLSLLGARIIYYDMHLAAGLGVTGFEHYRPNKSALTDMSITYLWGVGQRFYITNALSLRLDYRNQIYKETIREKVITATKGDVIGHRTVFGHTIGLGLDYMFSLF